jgi:hypothetical protein
MILGSGLAYLHISSWTCLTSSGNLFSPYWGGMNGCAAGLRGVAVGFIRDWRDAIEASLTNFAKYPGAKTSVTNL